jgi:hypothetical protein
MQAPVSIIIESDDDSEGRASCVILKTETGSYQPLNFPSKSQGAFFSMDETQREI